MGLDMMLYKRKWVGPEAREAMELKGLGDLVDPKQVHYMLEEAGYWRKANAIHRWFVEHAQDGRDDCGLYPVTHEELRTLLEQVEAVLAQPAIGPQVLPTQEGFFFGPTEYDEWYLEYLTDTKDIIQTALEDDDTGFEYTSSW